MKENQLIELILDLVKLPNESAWVEFKLNFHSPEEIGVRISALSNSACIYNKPFGYLVFGIEDKTHIIKGTSFKAKNHKKSEEDLEHWLINRLNPRIDFTVHEFDYDLQRHISMYIIPAAKNQPIEFLHQAYIRIASITRKLNEYPEKQAKIWKKDALPFEKEIAKDNLDISDIFKYLSAETYFDLLKMPYPTTQLAIVEKFIDEGIVIKQKMYAISKLGAILLAKNIRDFETIERKAIRIIVFKGKNKVETQREQMGAKGYALDFATMIDWINSQLPANEEIGKALRENTTMYPQIAIRELVANALIHQDFTEKGFPMVEIFTDRIEISNAGIPLVETNRFIDSYVSRNDKLADMMRRMGFCEEKGSGLDKVIFYNELYQLPPIKIVVDKNRTTLTLYTYKTINNLDKYEKMQACYQHACLKYVSNEKMTNQTIRDRFKIENQNAAVASRIIKETVDANLIKEEDPESNSRKYASYIPFWA